MNALSSGGALEPTQVAQTAQNKVAAFRTKLKADTSFVSKFKNDLKTEFQTQGVTLTPAQIAQFDNFDIGSVTTEPTVTNTATLAPAKKEDKKVLYIGVGAGVGGLALLGILFAVCKKRQTLDKIDPNLQHDGAVVPGGAPPMVGQQV